MWIGWDLLKKVQEDEFRQKLADYSYVSEMIEVLSPLVCLSFFSITGLPRGPAISSSIFRRDRRFGGELKVTAHALPHLASRQVTVERQL